MVGFKGYLEFKILFLRFFGRIFFYNYMVYSSLKFFGEFIYYRVVFKFYIKRNFLLEYWKEM